MFSLVSVRGITLYPLGRRFPRRGAVTGGSRFEPAFLSSKTGEAAFGLSFHSPVLSPGRKCCGKMPQARCSDDSIVLGLTPGGASPAPTKDYEADEWRG